MALVQAVDGYGRVTGRTIARPYGYGRGLMSVDPAYAPFLSGRYAPVRITYDPNVRTRTGAAVGLEATGEGEAPPGVPQPGESQGPESPIGGPSVYKEKKDWEILLENAEQKKNAPPKGNPAGNPGVQPRRGVPSKPGAVAVVGGKLAATDSYLMDANQMEKVKEIAISQYVNQVKGQDPTWKQGKALPLGIRSPNPVTTRADAISEMVTVAAKRAVSPRAIDSWKDYRPGTGISGSEEQGPGVTRRYKDGVAYYAYAPAFTQKSANSAYIDLGLFRADKASEISKWKLAFDMLGAYPTDARPNLNTTSWEAYETRAMAKFMEWANNDPRAYKSVADLTNLREDLMSQASELATKGADSGGARSYPYTTTNTQTQLSNMEDARETLRSRIADMIGRFPTDAEVRQFLGKLNDYERANPSTITTTWSDEDTSTTVGPSDDNLDPFNVVHDFAKTAVGGDYHAYQQLRYYQAISDILQSPAGMTQVPEVG